MQTKTVSCNHLALPSRDSEVSEPPSHRVIHMRHHFPRPVRSPAPALYTHSERVSPHRANGTIPTLQFSHGHTIYHTNTA